MHGAIFNIKRFAIHDGPGIRTTAFLQGCPLHCPWCHNPESIGPVRTCDTGEQPDSVFSTDSSELVGKLERDRVFYEESGGGITVSGGEPLMQPVFLLHILKKAAEIGLHTAVDTSGEADNQTVQSILPFTDLFLYDLKLIDPAEHKKWTGVSNDRILENLKLVCKSGKPVWIRIPLIANITDNETNITGIADHVADLSGIQRIHVLPYHAGGEHKWKRNASSSRLNLKPPDAKRIRDICHILEQTGIPVFTGG